MRDVAIVDYGMANTDSVARAFEKLGATSRLCRDAAAIAGSTHIVVPGVGAFGRAMDNLRSSGLADALQDAAAAGKPILGICLGMQLMANRSTEDGEHEGLGIIPGDVVRLAPQEGERIPHVGWNEVHVTEQARDTLQDFDNGSDFYFVHSYRFVPSDDRDAWARTPYCGGFVSIVGRGNCIGTQFHPEKSGLNGASLLAGYLRR